MKFKEGLDLEGKEGEVLSDVSQFKGKVLSSTLPYRIQFMIPHEEAGEVKVIAHLVSSSAVHGVDMQLSCRCSLFGN